MEVRRLYAGTLEDLRFTGAGEAKLFPVVNRGALEDVILSFPVDVVRRRQREGFGAGETLLRRYMPELYELVGIRERQRPQEDSVNDAEDSCVRADADCEDDEGRNRESWLLPE